MVRTRVTKRDKRGGTGTGPAQSVLSGRDTDKTERYETIALRSIVENLEAPATARVQAARTLAEMDGRIGRHQVAPSRVASEGLASLSRDQLVSELERLREVCDLGLTPWSR